MAAVLVGGALLSSFLQVAFDRLASRDFLHIFQAKGLDETLLNKLNIALLSINSVIDDAEQKQITDPNVKSWLDKVKDAAYDAEDILDEIDYQVTKRKVEVEVQSSNVSRKVRNFFAASVTSFDNKVESRMKLVLENLEYLESRKDILGLKEGCGVVAGSVRKLPTTSLVVEDGICGRDDDKEMIIKWLLSDDYNNGVPIISIVGMGGLGKTTLVQLVYNDKRVNDDFDLKAWVCVSNEFDITRVTRAIIEAITMSNDDTKDLNVLQIKLKEMLTGKRFLLVLDDLWNESYMQWDALQTPFNHGALGSKIIVTTRSFIVASTVRSVKTYPLKPLIEEDSWLLFRKYAFHNGDAPHSNSDFEEIGRKIIKKCRGLPLTLKAIGSLLYTKLSVEEWNAILGSEIWEEGSDILPALRLSYYYLPSILKRCFAYCSIFPKDYEFSKDRLVQLWMAENFFSCASKGKDLKEVGDQLFHDLLSRSFFQLSSGDESRYVMHDLINDLAKNVSGNFCFRLEVDEAQNVSNMTRHFSYLSKLQDATKRFEAINKANRLRTFLSFPMYHRNYYHLMSSKTILDLLSKFRCLRVLSLSHYCNIIELPRSVGDLKHLRYLDLSYTGVARLPDSICLLYNLQTLKLRHCIRLHKLPSNLHKLISLRHLDFCETSITEMPKNLRNLKNLRVLSSFYVGKCSETNIRQLEELNLWGTLSISELQNIVYPMDALATNLKNKIYLEELKLGWRMRNVESENDKHVLENLQPHRNLKKLSISNYGGIRFPNWFADNSLFNVVSIELSNCQYCFFLPPLGLLPSLKSLTVIGFDSIETIGPEFYGNRSGTIPFGTLVILRFQHMVGWEEWKCENFSSAFPCLQELYIKDCPMLKEHLPAQLPSLKKLNIVNCKQLVASIPWAPAIHELVLANYGKLKLGYLPSTLIVLRIIGRFTQSSLDEKIDHIIANTCLEELDVLDCANMELPLRNCHNFLQKVTIKSSCYSLKIFPLDLFPKLQSLELIDCSNLEMIFVSDGHHLGLACFTRLKICNCPKFASFPEGGFFAPKLDYCRIDHLESLKALPEHMHILFPSLRHLGIYRCPQMESFHEEVLPLNLKTLIIWSCPKLMASLRKWNLHSHSSLQYLSISDPDVKCLPDAGPLPSTLITLDIYDSPNLRTLDNEGLCLLSALKRLTLDNCPKLQCLPNEGLPNSLSTLEISRCPLLKEQCVKQKGKEWAKIAHIPCVIIDKDIVT